MGEESIPNAATDEEAVDLLWDQIFKTCRVYADDPVAAWKDHEEKKFSAKSSHLKQRTIREITLHCPQGQT